MSGTKRLITINPMNTTTIIPISTASSILCVFSFRAREIRKDENP